MENEPRGFKANELLPISNEEIRTLVHSFCASLPERPDVEITSTDSLPSDPDNALRVWLKVKSSKDSSDRQGSSIGYPQTVIVEKSGGKYVPTELWTLRSDGAPEKYRVTSRQGGYNFDKQ